MKHAWTLIDNATHARLVQRQPGRRLQVLRSFSHPQSRSRAGELADDRAGHERSDRGFGGVSYPPRLDAKRKEHLQFARELATYLEQQALQGQFDSIALFASSQFLGHLKAQLGDATARALAGTYDVDLTAVGPAELERRIEQEISRAKAT